MRGAGFSWNGSLLRGDGLVVDYFRRPIFGAVTLAWVLAAFHAVAIVGLFCSDGVLLALSCRRMTVVLTVLQ